MPHTRENANRNMDRDTRFIQNFDYDDDYDKYFRDEICICTYDHGTNYIFTLYCYEWRGENMSSIIYTQVFFKAIR